MLATLLDRIAQHSGSRPVPRILLANRFPIWVTQPTPHNPRGDDTPDAAAVRGHITQHWHAYHIFAAAHEETPVAPHAREYAPAFTQFVEDCEVLAIDYLPTRARADFPFLDAALDAHTRATHDLVLFLRKQGNVRGVPPTASTQTFRDAFSAFTTPKRDLYCTYVFALTERMNARCDYPAGMAPLLLDEEFREAHPEETLLLAREYAPTIDFVINQGISRYSEWSRPLPELRERIHRMYGV